MRLTWIAPLCAAAIVLAVVPGPAGADTVITGSVGRATGGDLEEGHLSYGAAIAFTGNGPLGFEVEGTYTPDVFGDTPGGTNNITTLMGNVVLGLPAGDTVRVYATAGAGLLKFRVPDVDEFFDVNSTDFGVNAGAGVIVRLGDRLGVRGDLRYFRDLKDTEPDNEFDVDFGGFRYWRGSVGVTLQF